MIINEQIPPRIQTLEKDTNCNCWSCCKAHALFNLLYMFFGICIVYIIIYVSTQHPTLQTFLAVQAQAKKKQVLLVGCVETFLRQAPLHLLRGN